MDRQAWGHFFRWVGITLMFLSVVFGAMFNVSNYSRSTNAELALFVLYWTIPFLIGLLFVSLGQSLIRPRHQAE